MKKLIALVLALVMCFALCACGQSAAPAATEAPAAEPAADAAADTAAVEYPEMTLKLSHHNAVDQPIHEALTKWATMINEQSGGKITIDSFVRFEKGEGLQKREDNLAEEVAKMTAGQ